HCPQRTVKEQSCMEGEVSLVAGRSQREKRRSYKDLLREEEIIDAEVRNTSKKWLKDADVFYSGGELQKKKHCEDHLYRGVCLERVL
uniref:Uncharacterized protein n=1 Tax=Cyprinus carpio carpio TaxID=630221 RepID=A0A8C1HUY2_CYPCA